MHKDLIVVLITALALGGCLGWRSPDAMYQLWMNMDVPSTVSDLTYGELREESGTASYITYHATAAYFDFLTRSDIYLHKEGRAWQQRIKLRSCTASDFQLIFTKWVADISDFTDKQCYYGIVGGNAHYIVYDSRTLRVYHVIDWVRD